MGGGVVGVSLNAMFDVERALAAHERQPVGRVVAMLRCVDSLQLIGPGDHVHIVGGPYAPSRGTVAARPHGRPAAASTSLYVFLAGLRLAVMPRAWMERIA